MGLCMPEDISIEAHIPTELDEELNRLASARGETKAALVRQALAEFVLSDAGNGATPRNSETKSGSEQSETDWLEWDWTQWDAFDFVSVLGIVLVILGFIAAFVHPLRAAGVLVPIGLGCMTLAAYGAHHRDADAS
jgi:Ribbon-helix-helix protein, copG family